MLLENGDDLSDTLQCQIDASIIKDVGFNTLYVFDVIPNVSHSGCMQAFESQGIYLWIDVSPSNFSTSNFWIDTTSPEWTIDTFNRFASVVDEFAPYNNTLALLIHQPPTGGLVGDLDSYGFVPYAKAAIRDIKAYRDARGYRKVPIAYESALGVAIPATVADYLGCGDANDAVDVFCISSWCSYSTYYPDTDYDTLYQQFTHLNIPVVFSVGCNNEPPRNWVDVDVILGALLSSVFSGLIASVWDSGSSFDGLVDYPYDNSSGIPSTLENYNNLKAVFRTVSPTSTAQSVYSPSNNPPACPASSGDWTINPSASLPTIAALNLETVSAIASKADTPTPTTSANAEGSNITSNSGAISRGAVAGIVVSCVVVAVAFGALVFFWLRRWRAQSGALVRHGSDSGANAGRIGYDGKAELPGMPVTRKREFWKQELDGLEKKGGMSVSRQIHGIYEAVPYQQQYPYEMEGSMPHNEMDGSTTAKEVEIEVEVKLHRGQEGGRSDET